MSHGQAHVTKQRNSVSNEQTSHLPVVRVHVTGAGNRYYVVRKRTHPAVRLSSGRVHVICSELSRVSRIAVTSERELQAVDHRADASGGQKPRGRRSRGSADREVRR